MPRRSTADIRPKAAPIAVLGVPIDNVSADEAVVLIEQMIATGRPHYLATANVDFLVQALHDVELRRILFDAHLVLCDGTPVLWASRWLGNPLQERVAGSDLVPRLIQVAATKGYRLFFLGGSSEATETAVEKLRQRYPALIIADYFSPPFRELLQMDHEEIRRRIRTAKPDLLFVSFGCPKQEKWIAMHYQSLGVPVAVGVGATIDFLAGRVARAPQWMRRLGLEWVFRLAQEPRRLLRRYCRDCWYFLLFLLAQWSRTGWRLRRHRGRPPATVHDLIAVREIWCPEWLDALAVTRDADVWTQAGEADAHIVVRLDQVRFIDSTGIGLLIRLRKRLAQRKRELVLVGTTPPVRRCLHAMRLWPFFLSAENGEAAMRLLAELGQARPTGLQLAAGDVAAVLEWRGEVTAANAPQVWQETETYLTGQASSRGRFAIDLSSVRFIDSTGIGLLIRAKKWAQQVGARLDLLAPSANVLNVIRLARLEAYLLGDCPLANVLEKEQDNRWRAHENPR